MYLWGTVAGGQCDQIGLFIALWTTFQSQWQKLFAQIIHIFCNFCKGVKIYHYSSAINFRQLLWTFGDFLLVTLQVALLRILSLYVSRLALSRCVVRLQCCYLLMFMYRILFSRLWPLRAFADLRQFELLGRCVLKFGEGLGSAFEFVGKFESTWYAVVVWVLKTRRLIFYRMDA